VPDAGAEKPSANWHLLARRGTWPVSLDSRVGVL
jgi:hypothetical protein